MIYIDSSVALAHIISEQRRPEPAFWQQPMISSQLLRYEVWNRLHAYGAEPSRDHRAVEVFRSIALLELSDEVLARALRPFPIPVRTLDGLHLASMEFLRAQGRTLELASYDARLLAAAGAMGFAALQP